MMNPTVLRLTLRGLVGRRRFLLLLPLPVLVVGLAVLVAALGVAATDWGRPVLVDLGLGLALPVMALIVGASVLGSEIDDGTAVHVLAKPLPRREIVLSKLLVAVGVTVVMVGAAMVAAGLVAERAAGLAIGLLAGTAVGGVAYCAVFLALSLLTRRPVLVGLVYVLVWEMLLGNLLEGTRVLSIHQYAVTVADRVADTTLFAGTVSLPVSLVMAGVIVVGATVLAIDRLRSFSLAGDVS